MTGGQGQEGRRRGGKGKGVVGMGEMERRGIGVQGTWQGVGGVMRGRLKERVLAWEGEGYGEEVLGWVREGERCAYQEGWEGEQGRGGSGVFCSGRDGEVHEDGGVEESEDEARGGDAIGSGKEGRDMQLQEVEVVCGWKGAK